MGKLLHSAKWGQFLHVGFWSRKKVGAFQYNLCGILFCQVDLERLSECSEYFRGASQSRMRETSEGVIRLAHVPASVFHNLLEFSFRQRFRVPEEELADNIQVYRRAPVLPLTPQGCLSSLHAEQIEEGVGE